MNDEVSPIEAAAEGEAPTPTVIAPNDDAAASTSIRAQLFELDNTAVDALLRSRKPLVAMLAGDVNAGKTSCLASLAIILLNSAIGSRYFAGSESMHGLARMALSVSVQGKVEKPSLARTPTGGVRGQHIRIFDEDCTAAQDVIFLDMAGEDYREAATGGQITLIAPLTRADIIMFCFDGERLLKEEVAQEELSFLLDLLRRSNDNELIRSESHLLLVFTKQDLWAGNEQALTLRAFAVERFLKTANRHDVQIIDVAAVPASTSEVMFGTGIATLFNATVSVSGFQLAVASASDFEEPEWQYLKFGRAL